MATRAYDWIAHYARTTPQQLAVVDLHEHRPLTYRAFD